MSSSVQVVVTHSLDRKTAQGSFGLQNRQNLYVDVRDVQRLIELMMQFRSEPTGQNCIDS